MHVTALNRLLTRPASVGVEQLLKLLLRMQGDVDNCYDICVKFYRTLLFLLEIFLLKWVAAF